MWYSMGDDEQRFECDVSHLSINRKLDMEMMANQCAEDYFHNHDGWESPWPRDLFLYETEYGPSIAKLFVEMEAEPVFYSRTSTKYEPERISK